MSGPINRDPIRCRPNLAAWHGKVFFVCLYCMKCIIFVQVDVSGLLDLSVVQTSKLSKYKQQLEMHKQMRESRFPLYGFQMAALRLNSFENKYFVDVLIFGKSSKNMKMHRKMRKSRFPSTGSKCHGATICWHLGSTPCDRFNSQEYTVRLFASLMSTRCDRFDTHENTVQPFSGITSARCDRFDNHEYMERPFFDT